MAKKSFKIGLNRLAGELGRQLSEYRKRKLYADIRDEETQKYLANQRLQIYMQERAQAFRAQQAGEARAQDIDKFNRKLAQQRELTEKELGIEADKVKAMKLRAVRENRKSQQDDFRYLYALYNQNLALLKGQLSDEQGRTIPDVNRIKNLYMKIREMESMRDEYGRTVGKPLGFIAPKISVSDYLNIRDRTINKYKSQISTELPERARDILARKQAAFGFTRDYSEVQKNKKPLLSDIMER